MDATALRAGVGTPAEAADEQARSAGLRFVDRVALARADVVSGLLLACGTVLWARSVTALPLHAMTDIGIASVLPPITWFAYGLIVLAFVVALRSGRTATLIVALATTVVVVHGLGPLAVSDLQFAVAWRHIGIADYLRGHGAVDPNLDAYQNWPGFFALCAFLWDAAGLSNPESVVAWAPVFFNLLYLVPIIAIGMRVLPDHRAAWLGAWLFTVANWIGQDYFSPQGFYLFIYLTVLAVVLEWFKTPRRSGEGAAAAVRPSWMARSAHPGPAPEPPADAVSSAVQRRVLVGVLMVLMAALISSHQLTPFVLVLGLTLLVVTGWCRLRWLPLVALMGAMYWLGYGANIYFNGHSDQLVSQIGALGSIFEQSVSSRLVGTPGHLAIGKLRILETGAVWLLAVVGLLRLVRHGRFGTARGLGAIALAPFLTLALESYGGEAVLRVAMFALPFVALLAAVALIGLNELRIHHLAAVATVGAALILLFPLTRYGNERMDWFSQEEVAMVGRMYQLAPPGSVLTSVTGGLPWRYTKYADYDYRILLAGSTAVAGQNDDNQGAPVDLAVPDLHEVAEQVASRMEGVPGQRSFLEISRSQGAEMDMQSPFPVGTFDHLKAALQTSDMFQQVAANHDAALFELRPSGAR